MSVSTSAILEAVATAKMYSRLYACDYFVCMKERRILLLTELRKAQIAVDEVIFSTKSGYTTSI